MKCKDCKWFEIDPGDNTDGRCHRFPPNQRDMNSVEFFVAVNNEDWCGEFEKKETKERFFSESDLS